MKKLVIVEHNAKRFESRLWNDMSITACSLALHARVVNLTTLEHTLFGRPLHWLCARIVDRATRATCGRWTMGTPKLLPPTVPTTGQFAACQTLYFFGWLFRNPVGMAQYRDRLIARFAPRTHVRAHIDRLMAAQPPGLVTIGVHIQLKPFTGFTSGEFLISSARVRQIVEEYLREKQLRAEDVALVVATDARLPSSAFEGFAATVSVADAETSLFLLSKCSVVIGTNSRLANLAAWFGNVPHIVTTNEPIDWAYYKNKTAYFENAYATFTHGLL